MRLHVKKYIIKNKTWIMILILLLLFYLWKVPFSYEINKSITALQVSRQNKTETVVHINIKGTYSTYIFGEDKFYGNIIIDRFEATNETYKVNINISPDKLEKLEYKKFSGPQIESQLFGLIMVDNNFKSFAIIPFNEYFLNPSYAKSGGLIVMDKDLITALYYPATTRNEGMEILNSKLRKAINNFKREK